MLTTELSARALFTLLLLGPIRGGLCQLQGDQNEDTWARTGEIKRDEPESRDASSSEAGILLPADDKYNFVGDDDPSYASKTVWRSGRDSGRSSPFPATTVVSTNSYSVRPGGSSSSSSSSGAGTGSSVFLNTKPLTIVTTGNGYNGQSPYSPPKGNYDSLYTSPHSKNNDKTTVYVKNNCYGSRCPTSSRRPDQHDDDNKSYHYVMNKDVKQKLKRYNEGPIRRTGEFGEFPLEHQMTLSLPFRVEPAVPQKDLKYPYRFPNQNRNNRRVSRTTTTTPGWVKLQPIFPDQYDLFSLNNTKMYSPEQAALENNSKFSNRLGIELNPESFANRWGWGGDSQSHNQDQGSGSRLPTWLQQIHSSFKGGPTRDSDNKNWVKLDPIRITGTSISKWAPKGTPTSELPTTNWPSRDHRPGGSFISNSNNYNPNPNKWNDHLDSFNKLSRPSYVPHPISLESHQGWAPNKHSHPQSPSSWDRTPTNQWDEVVYPEGPSSATASWQQDKDTKYPSSFSGSTPSSSPWPSDTRRPGTGSWSADRGRPQFSNQPYGGNRRQGSHSYPDGNSHDPDSRWVLVSNSRKVSVSPSESHRGSNYNDRPKYHPSFDKFADFPFYFENPNGHRVGKNVKSLLVTAPSKSSSNPEVSDQDDAFKKINATLSNLTPVLSVRGSPSRRPSDSDLNKIRTPSKPKKVTNKPRVKLPAFMKPYAGDGRAVVGNTTVSSPLQQIRQGLSINPVYAAMGAGMIPATMAAVLPMMLGRKRRDVSHFNSNNLPKMKSEIQRNGPPSASLIFLNNDSTARFLMSQPYIYGNRVSRFAKGNDLSKT